MGYSHLIDDLRVSILKVQIEELLLVEALATEATGPLRGSITFLGIVSRGEQVPQWMQWTFQWQFDLTVIFIVNRGETVN